MNTHTPSHPHALSLTHTPTRTHSRTFTLERDGSGRETVTFLLEHWTWMNNELKLRSGWRHGTRFQFSYRNFLQLVAKMHFLKNWVVLIFRRSKNTAAAALRWNCNEPIWVKVVRVARSEFSTLMHSEAILQFQHNLCWFSKRERESQQQQQLRQCLNGSVRRFVLVLESNALHV